MESNPSRPVSGDESGAYAVGVVDEQNGLAVEQLLSHHQRPVQTAHGMLSASAAK